MKKVFYLFLVLSFFQKNISAQFVFDNGETAIEETAVQPPLKNKEISFENYMVEANQSSIVQHPSGTKIIIPPNAFVDVNGKIVKGKVNLKFREFNNPLDIYLSGIPMTVDQNGKKEFFQSAGMIELRVTQNKQEVFPNPDGEMINIEITSNQLEDDFQLYNLDETSGEWIEEGKDEVLWNSKDIITKKPAEPIFGDNNNNDIIAQKASTSPNYFIPPVSPSMRLSSFNFLKLRTDSDKELKRHLRKVKRYKSSFQFKLSPPKYNRKKINKDTKNLTKTFPELDYFRKLPWIYDGDNKRKTAKFFFELNRTYHKKKTEKDVVSQFSLEDITIHPNLENDNYDIKFSFKDTVVIISAFPYFSTSNPISIQKRNKEFYKKYRKKYDQRCQEWKELEILHNVNLVNYQLELEEFQRKIIDKDILAALSPGQIQRGVTRRRIPTFTFGILNVDKVMKRIDQKILVEFINEEGNKIEYEYVAVLDQGNNAMLTYEAGEKIRFDSQSNNSLIIVLTNETKAIVDSESFKVAYGTRKKNKMIIPVKLLNLKKINKKELSNALASN